LDGRYPSLVVIPVGVGGLAQAAVTHYKAPHIASQSTRVLGVEPESAAALQASLRQGEVVNIETKAGGTILKSLNYGTVTEKSWEVLKNGLDLCTAVKDEDVKRATDELQKGGVEVGPCGGAVVAGLKAVVQDNSGFLRLSKESVVVLISTEGMR